MPDGVSARPASASDAGGRVGERASNRARDLHRMRGAILAFVLFVAAAQLVLTAMWLGSAYIGNLEAARGWGLMTVLVNVAVTFILVFVTWIVLEALGRIERETDRVQQFMDTVYRRLV
jgi:uncharacterized membrane protein